MNTITKIGISGENLHTSELIPISPSGKQSQYQDVINAKVGTSLALIRGNRGVGNL